ncbi:CCA tRNA nucleotidyltransferase [Lyticum sinuosum]|uniref:CCA-adding enzyme n=1 Tax=Lyticum sinuosum TaxID=1332059 RepID=A0AAE5AGP0_9RICK|nr:hypothetical protein [Lyticum sinuosum]MDZ5761012.1 CCA-adding enzyme [Lyticum sinuosum]
MSKEINIQESLSIANHFNISLIDLLPKSALRILYYIPNTRVVGGWIRDIIYHNMFNSDKNNYNLEKSFNEDIDFATELLPNEVKNIFDTYNVKTILIGINHGTIGAIIDNILYEITTLRKDVKCDGRHAEVVFGVDWVEDARRRDFTINALSMDKDGIIYDYFNGINDIKNNSLKFIGNPDKRIKEDYLRILRYFRFSCKLNLSQNKELEEIFLSNCSGLLNISGERIFKEMQKILNSQQDILKEAIIMMYKSNILKYIGLFDEDECLDKLYSNTNELLFANNDGLLNLASLINWCVKIKNNTCNISNIKNNYEKKLFLAKKIALQWKLSKKERQQLLEYIITRDHIDNLEKRLFLAYNIGLEKYYKILQSVVMQNEISNYEKSLYLSEVEFLNKNPIFPLNGEDIINKFSVYGKKISFLLKKAKVLWLLSEAKNDKEYLLNNLC